MVCRHDAHVVQIVEMRVRRHLEARVCHEPTRCEGDAFRRVVRSRVLKNVRKLARHCIKLSLDLADAAGV